MDLIFFGTGSSALSAVEKVDFSRNKILAVSDNNAEKWFTNWQGYDIIPPTDLLKLDYDYILVCSMYTQEISDSLIKIGIERRKILPLFDNVDWKKEIIEHNNIRKNLFISHSSNKIALVTRRNSGCNARALYSFKPNSLKNSTEINLLDLNEFKERYDSYNKSVTTSLEGRFYKTLINIETWHGFPIKSLGNFEKNRIDPIANTNEGITYIASYSNFYSFIISSVYKIDIEKFIVTGMPRNDFLNNKDSRHLISLILNKKIEKKRIIFYVPTFRKRKDKNVWEGKSLNINHAELTILDNFLGDIDTYLIIKKHPAENDIFLNNNYKNIFYIEEEDLKHLDIDFYEILGGSDLLLTDYSSVYFDYLLLNKPIVFWLKDKDMYESNRGFLFENVEELMPGPIEYNIQGVMISIKKMLENKELFNSERNHIKNLIHKYKDFNSSERMWEFILSLK